MTMMDGFLFGIGFIGAAVACGVFVVVVSAITNAIASLFEHQENGK